MLYIGNGIDDCGEWIYVRTMSSGMQGWLLREAVKLHIVDGLKPVVGDVMIVREMVAAPSLGYLALDPGDIVYVQYVGSTWSKDLGWLFGECPQGSKNRGWFPAAMMYPRESIVIKVHRGLSGELLAIVELQPSDTLDALPQVVSNASREDVIACDFFHGTQLLAGPQTFFEANLTSGSKIVAVRSSLPHVFTAERALTDMFVVKRWTHDCQNHETICEVSDPVLLLEASQDSRMVVVVGSWARQV